MRLDTKRNIGNAGLSMAIAYFGTNGYTVSVPLNDTQDYDLIVDMDGSLKKVQVKASNCKETSNSYTVQLRTISGTTRKAYKTVADTDIDFLFCLCGDGTMFLIPKDEIVNRIFCLRFDSVAPPKSRHPPKLNRKDVVVMRNLKAILL